MTLEDVQNIAHAASSSPIAAEHPLMPYDPNRISGMVLKYKADTGLSWRALAERVGCSSGTLRAIAKGDTMAMRLDTAYRLAEAMGIEIWELIGDAPKEIGRSRALVAQLKAALAASRQAASARDALEVEIAEFERVLSPD
jgi:transcriptional regulator with XRE-family HTH domain